MKRRWLKYIVIPCATFIIVILTLASFQAYQLFYKPMLKNAAPVTIHLDKYTSASSFVRTLKQQHLIKSERLLLALIRLRGFTSQLKAGIYQINEGDSAYGFLLRVVDGDVLKKSFSIIEGTTKNQVDANLATAEYLTHHDSDWLLIKKTFPSAEGLLLADTYHYDAGSESKDLLRQANNNLRQVLEHAWQQRAPNLPYTSSYDLLIAASIIEKESSLASEKRLIAGVIINRLHKKMPLQMDPTVIYALGLRYTGKLTHEDMQIDSPYNSYRYRGLPPTPIAMVGKEAIEAAAHPQLSNYLYFVAKGDGSHFFSETYDQQRLAIDRYLKKGN